MAAPSDEEVVTLLNRIARGPDQEGAAKAIHRYFYKPLWAYLRSRCSDESGIEEVTQDVFMAVFNQPDAYQGKSRFTTWLFGIANFKLADWQRSQMRHSSRRADLDEEVIETIEAPDWDFITKLESKQLLELLRTCIALLPALHREIIIDVALHELSESEASMLLRCPPGTVKSRLSAARRKLFTCVSSGSAGTA